MVVRASSFVCHQSYRAGASNTHPARPENGARSATGARTPLAATPPTRVALRREPAARRPVLALDHESLSVAGVAAGISGPGKSEIRSMIPISKVTVRGSRETAAVP
ncbi:hypothetical protein GCM10009687_15330 [Asanoa iriomotensis]|uniref:Uncharacterized protein n=1 Tax=Asanoa iriomotensis TaxID=234613 RepID=A0ABQ4C1R4_9ACTN|nr:hypothetical protein Air01nite_23250 [Asanoa iriomotensis]